MNLYLHFPFCRTRCAYCTLYSRTGVSPRQRDDYVHQLADDIASRNDLTKISTVYFGGGSPALCELSPVLDQLRPRLTADCEFTVELHPRQVTVDKLAQLRDGGVNRISMGVQSFDDRVLAAMGREYTAVEALNAFHLIRRHFDNAGIDLIVGLPGDDTQRWDEWLGRYQAEGMCHCSVYSLQNERRLTNVPDDDTLLDNIHRTAAILAQLGLCRYEISNYALPGNECRHNLAVWRGEDYLGLGEGACGRCGLKRTRGIRKDGVIAYADETVDADFDRRERAIFRLRTREGLDVSGFEEWRPTLERLAATGLLTRIDAATYRLTERGTETCDAIMADIIAAS